MLYRKKQKPTYFNSIAGAIGGTLLGAVVSKPNETIQSALIGGVGGGIVGLIKDQGGEGLFSTTDLVSGVQNALSN